MKTVTIYTDGELRSIIEKSAAGVNPVTHYE